VFLRLPDLLIVFYLLLELQLNRLDFVFLYALGSLGINANAELYDSGIRNHFKL